MSLEDHPRTGWPSTRKNNKDLEKVYYILVKVVEAMMAYLRWLVCLAVLVDFARECL